MDQTQDISWQDGEMLEATEPSIVSTMAEEVPTLTAAAIVGVTVVVLLTIAAVFLLGLLIDCRQQKLLEQMGRLKKVSTQKRVTKNGTTSSASEDVDVISIAGNMEEQATSTPPAEQLRNIP